MMRIDKDSGEGYWLQGSLLPQARALTHPNCETKIGKDDRSHIKNAKKIFI